LVSRSGAKGLSLGSPDQVAEVLVSRPPAKF